MRTRLLNSDAGSGNNWMRPQKSWGGEWFPHHRSMHRLPNAHPIHLQPSPSSHPTSLPQAYLGIWASFSTSVPSRERRGGTCSFIVLSLSHFSCGGRELGFCFCFLSGMAFGSSSFLGWRWPGPLHTGTVFFHGHGGVNCFKLWVCVLDRWRNLENSLMTKPVFLFCFVVGLGTELRDSLGANAPPLSLSPAPQSLVFQSDGFLCFPDICSGFTTEYGLSPFFRPAITILISFWAYTSTE